MSQLPKQSQAAAAFAKKWAGRGYEKGETQPFWLELLQDVFNVEQVYDYIHFEERIKFKHTSFMDAHIPATHVIIEQKSLDVDLEASIRQSDGNLLTPAEQAKRYGYELPYSMRPRWIVACNFAKFLIYDMERPTEKPQEILLKDLGKEYHRLHFLVDTSIARVRQEKEVSFKAGRIVGELYDEILKAYKDPTAESTLKSLNKLCVRLVFCLYAEDAEVFGCKDMFHDYLQNIPDLRRGLIELFRVLDTKVEERDPYLEDALAAFPYVNGGLFRGDIEIPRLNDRVRELLLTRASEDFDWSDISPTIFGALFESTLNPETRREGGMHYTEIENIHKVIDPLFLDGLREELAKIKAQKETKARMRNLQQFQEKLASLVFFDPACGSGNFLTETYLSLRRIENEVIQLLNRDQMTMGDISNPIRVSIEQFYGIEINDFASTVASTALWIAEAQMMEETERIVHFNLDPLPLKSYNNITEGNALRLDWRECVPVERLNYIMGNPPFIGARNMSNSQKEDITSVFGAKWKNVGNLDYVCGWYKKATDLMQDYPIRTALVSTNSITQGEQVANLWQPLVEEQGLHIDFAHRTFVWKSESTDQAHVHCVIIGCSITPYKGNNYIFDNGAIINAKNINAYLLDCPNIFIGSRSRPLCDVPTIGIGNQPIDGGNYLFTKEEMEEFIAIEPKSAQYFRPWYGAIEFIQQKPRFCLWLGDCVPAELRAMPHCMERVKKVREFRSASKRVATQKVAETPTRFFIENMPESSYIIIPSVSSENRKYIPMGFMGSDTMASNLVLIMPEGNLYHFGVLTSAMHMAWTKCVCGRLKSDFRYSAGIVYNNFPWAENPSPKQVERIEQCTEAVLEARKIFPDASLADLYDPLAMPPALMKAHQALDKAVDAAYRSTPFTSDEERLRYLFGLYEELTKSIR